MRYQTHSRSSVFLTELIITIFFFSLAAVVCVRLFVGAARTSADSRNLTRAVSLAQDASECFIAADGDPEEFRSLMELVCSGLEVSQPSAGPLSPSDLRACFDRDWNISKEGIYKAEFLISHEPSGPGGVMHCLRTRIADADGNEIYSLETLQYSPSGNAGKEAP